MLISKKSSKQYELETIKYGTLPVLQFFIANESTAAMLLFPWATYSSEIRKGFSRCPTLLWSSTHLHSSYRKGKEQRRRMIRKAILRGPKPSEKQLCIWLAILYLVLSSPHHLMVLHGQCLPLLWILQKQTSKHQDFHRAKMLKTQVNNGLLLSSVALLCSWTSQRCLPAVSKKLNCLYKASCEICSTRVYAL